MSLWENYRKVCFIAPFAPPAWSGYAIVTAWNPASHWISARRNARRQRALWRLVDDSADVIAMGPLWGSALDEDWQEESLLLLAPRGEAIRLAAAFGQNAIYWVEQGELWLVPVLLQGTPLHLGRLVSHWIVRGPA